MKKPCEIRDLHKPRFRRNDFGNLTIIKRVGVAKTLAVQIQLSQLLSVSEKDLRSV